MFKRIHSGLDEEQAQENVIKYCSWKYYFSPMLHATSLTICVAYNIYLEVAEGQIDSDRKIETPVNFWNRG